jgi:hypothetical protein
MRAVESIIWRPMAVMDAAMATQGRNPLEAPQNPYALFITILYDNWRLQGSLSRWHDGYG